MTCCGNALLQKDLPWVFLKINLNPGYCDKKKACHFYHTKPSEAWHFFQKATDIQIVAHGKNLIEISRSKGRKF